VILRLALAAALTACSFPAKHAGVEDAAPAGVEDAPDLGTRFGCQGAPFGITAPQRITISGQVLDLGTGVAATNTQVHGVLDTGAVMFNSTTDASGSFSAVVDTGGSAVAAYVVTDTGAYVPSYYLPSHPFDRDTVAPLPVLTGVELTSQIGNAPHTALAQLILGDCLGAALAGCTLAVDPPPQRIEYARNGTPDATATATDATGYALVYGLRAGTVTFQASCPHGPLRAASPTVIADATYFLQLQP
jgi:hypothetical protein